MTSFRSDYKRAQPLLGTFFTISVANTESSEAESPVNQAFSEARRLEKIFSLHMAGSDLCRLNDAPSEELVAVSSELYYLLQLTEAVWRRSDGSFNPFLPSFFEKSTKIFHYQIIDRKFFIAKCGPAAGLRLDLNGIAKGYIIDRSAAVLIHALPKAKGVVNVGGDLRFFNTLQRCVTVRMGSPAIRLARSLLADRDGIATSSPAVAATDTASSTRYPCKLRADLTKEHTAVAMANCTTIADCLTKIALFGRQDVISSCAHSFGARVLVFDPEGHLAEEYGAA